MENISYGIIPSGVPFYGPNWKSPLLHFFASEYIRQHGHVIVMCTCHVQIMCNHTIHTHICVCPKHAQATNCTQPNIININPLSIIGPNIGESTSVRTMQYVIIEQILDDMVDDLKSQCDQLKYNQFLKIKMKNTWGKYSSNIGNHPNIFRMGAIACLYMFGTNVCVYDYVIAYSNVMMV